MPTTTPVPTPAGSTSDPIEAPAPATTDLAEIVWPPAEPRIRGRHRLPQSAVRPPAAALLSGLVSLATGRRAQIPGARRSPDRTTVVPAHAAELPTDVG